MLILALDTSAAAGSVALVRERAIVAERAGDPAHTHGERLPRELMSVLQAAATTLDEVDRFAVSIGPGSFTGLRIGIATIQGLALAQGKLVVPVSSFEALAFSARSLPHASVRPPDAIGVWIDAHRGEVFAALHDADGATLCEPSSLTPDATLDAWSAHVGGRPLRFVGDGAVKYRTAITNRLGQGGVILEAVPPLAGSIGLIAANDPDRAVRPHAVVPLYVRRSDAELARDRRQTAGG